MRIQRSAASKAADLAQVKLAALAQVHAEMLRLRLLFITDLPGQDGIYIDKRDEAKRYMTTPNPPADLAGFPYLANEVGVTAETAEDLARLWMAQAAKTTQAAGPALEGIRARAKAAIRGATTAADLEAALADFSAAVAAFQEAST